MLNWVRTSAALTVSLILLGYSVILSIALPVRSEQRGGAFTEVSQAGQQRVVAGRVGIEGVTVGRHLGGRVNSDTCALISLVGEGR